MVRHSGYLSSFAVILLAVLSVSILERRSAKGPGISRAAMVGTSLKPVGLDYFPPDSFRAVSKSLPFAGRPTATIRFRVPEDSLIIVGSLDASGAPHTLLISSRPDGGQIAGGSSSATDFFDLEYIDTESLSVLQRRFQEPKPGRLDRAALEISKRSGNLSVAHLPVVKPARRFLIPHFESDQVLQQPSEASLLADGPRVKVYLDLCIDHSNSDILQHQRMCDEANRVCVTLECELLPLIESWIGRISDLDGDQRLSVVLTDLDRRKSSAETPILGCVRRGDFSADHQNSLAGDIVYLDRHLPPQEQLRALLAHELTHAAIFCMRHEAAQDSPQKNHSIPSWLNEAAAHWVERQFCSSPAGYAAREAVFRQNPALCPIMLKEDDHYLTARGTGSRVAGFTFLQQHLTDVHDLRALLEQCTPFDQSISVIAEAPFSQLFRQWTISQTCGEHGAISPLHSTVSCCSLAAADNEPVRRKLHGTALLILRSETEQTVSIEAPRDAQLQITVLHQANSLSTQHSPDILTSASLESAGRKNLSNCRFQ